MRMVADGRGAAFGADVATVGRALLPSLDDELDAVAVQTLIINDSQTDRGLAVRVVRLAKCSTYALAHQRGRSA